MFMKILQTIPKGLTVILDPVELDQESMLSACSNGPKKIIDDIMSTIYFD